MTSCHSVVFPHVVSGDEGTCFFVLVRLFAVWRGGPPVRKEPPRYPGILTAIRGPPDPFALFFGAFPLIAPEPDPGLGGPRVNQCDNAFVLLQRPNGRQVSTSRNPVICAVFAVAAVPGFMKGFLSVEEFEAVAVNQGVSDSAPCMGVNMDCM